MMLDHYGKRNMQAVVAQRALLLGLAGTACRCCQRAGGQAQAPTPELPDPEVALIGELRPFLVAGV